MAIFDSVDDDLSLNPYAPPLSDLSPAVHSNDQKNTSLTVCCVIHVIVMLVALALEAYNHETIVGSGPIFALLGSFIAAISRRKDRELEFYAGVSAPVLVLLIVSLINYNGWSPATGDQPITIMISLYAAVAIPAFLCAVVRQLRMASHEPRIARHLTREGNDWTCCRVSEESFPD